MRFFITLSYDGAAYHGWQIQPNAPTVQQCLNVALSTLLRMPIETMGAGRTDTGVNAAMMVAHFDVPMALDCVALVRKLNSFLPQDIAVSRISQVDDNAHARFDAVSRTYHYHVYTAKNPFHRHYGMQLYYEPDFDLMNKAAAKLLEVTDFTSFSKLHTDVKTNNCDVMKAEWTQVGDNLWRFEIKADRFLRNMVRAIVGTLVDVGRGKYSIAEFEDIILSRDLSRCSAGAPACGLFLSDVKYDF
jgi:tRNA pseudouridine38-40 synthase